MELRDKAELFKELFAMANAQLPDGEFASEQTIELLSQVAYYAEDEFVNRVRKSLERSEIDE